MSADPVHPLLQHHHPVLDEVLLVPSRHLLVRQRRHRDQGELLLQAVVQPVKVLVPT